jgi:carbon monoxide dehydrogenase subunit G
VPAAQFTRTIDVGSDAGTCWERLTDVERVAQWVSIVGAVRELEPLHAYTAVLEDRMGPFRLRADLAIDVSDVVDGHKVRLRATGEDRQVASRIGVDATLRLESHGNGTTVTVDGTYEVTGRIATLGASMIRSKADKLLEEFFAAAGRELR